MALLTAGFWPTTFFPDAFWQEDYWQDYAAPSGTTQDVLMRGGLADNKTLMGGGMNP